MIIDRLHGWSRYDIVNLLSGNDNVGVELGVAEGVFGSHVVSSDKFSHLVGVDMYEGDRGHDVEQYKRAVKRIGVTSKYRVLRMRFTDALDLFEDNSIDFVYVDGYAHTGEESGGTFTDWYKKVRPGGILAGDDYTDKYPLVIQYVDKFCQAMGYDTIMLTDSMSHSNNREEKIYSRSPSWAIRKREV